MFEKIPVPIFSVIAAIEGVLLYKLITGEASVPLIAAILLAAILLLLIPYMEQLKTLSFGTDGFKLELEAIRKETYKNAEIIESLIFLSMGEWTYTNLLKINSGNFGSYELPASSGLKTELYYLRNVGYIALKQNSAPSIDEIPRTGTQLSDFIAITENGKKYIELREKASAHNVSG